MAVESELEGTAGCGFDNAIELLWWLFLYIHLRRSTGPGILRQGACIMDGHVGITDGYLTKGRNKWQCVDRYLPLANGIAAILSFLHDHVLALEEMG